MRPERKILEDHREVALLRSEQQLAIRERVEWVPELSAAVGLDDLDLQRLAVGHGADHRGDLREAGALANRVAVIEQGRLVQIGTMADLQARPATKFVEALLADRA